MLVRSQRAELFRVRRTKEVAGRKRFLQMECELERSRINAGITLWDNSATTWDAAPPNDTFWDLGLGLTEPYDATE